MLTIIFRKKHERNRSSNNNLQVRFVTCAINEDQSLEAISTQVDHSVDWIRSDVYCFYEMAGVLSKQAGPDRSFRPAPE